MKIKHNDFGKDVCKSVNRAPAKGLAVKITRLCCRAPLDRLDKIVGFPRVGLRRDVP